MARNPGKSSAQDFGLVGEAPLAQSIYGALATSHKGKSRVDAEADLDRVFICIVGVECGVM